MRRRSYRRKKLTKVVDTHGFRILKVSLVVGAILLAALITYGVSALSGRF